MAYCKDLRMPRLGESTGDMRLLHWHVQPAERFNSGDVLLEVETDKSIIEIPASEDGTLVEQLVSVGERLELDAPIAIIEVEGEDRSESPLPKTEHAYALTDQPASAETSAAVSQPAPSLADLSTAGVLGKRKFATPVARKVAREQALDIADVAGTGPHGRVTLADVNAALAQRRTSSSAASMRHGITPMAQEKIATGRGELHVRAWTPANPREAPTLFLVHGLFGDADVWAGIAGAATRAGLRTIAVDLPGHGRSCPGTGRFGDIVDSVADVVATLCQGPVTLAGHSFGAAVAARVARKPDLDIASLILLAPIGLGPEIEQSFLDGMVNIRSIAALERELGKLTVTGTMPSAVYLQSLRERLEAQTDALAALCREVSRNGVQQLDIAPDLNALACPVTLLHGRNDAIVPWEHALNAPARVALHLLPEVGHMPQWEATALAGELIVRAVTAGRLPW